MLDSKCKNKATNKTMMATMNKLKLTKNAGRSEELFSTTFHSWPSMTRYFCRV